MDNVCKWYVKYMVNRNIHVDVDYSSAIAVVIVIIGVVLSVVVNQIFKTNDDYDV